MSPYLKHLSYKNGGAFCAIESHPYIVVDRTNEIKIPQNDKSFFKIDKHQEWKYAIKIEFNYLEEISYFNLFLIIKSFVLNTSIPPYAVCISFKSDDDIEIISEKNDIKWIKSVDYFKFVEWINYITEKQSKYQRGDEFNGIIFLFSKGLLEIHKLENNGEDILAYMKPDYPWKPNFLNKFTNQIETIKILEAKIKYYENEKKK